MADLRDKPAAEREPADAEAGMDPLVPFGSAEGFFELDDLDAAAGVLRRLPEDPCVIAALRAALADPPALHALSRVSHRELPDWASIDLLSGEVVALIPRRGSAAGGRAKAAVAVAEAAPAAVAEEKIAAPAATWIAAHMTDGQGEPVKGLAYRIVLPDGSTREGKLDSNGLARVESSQSGTCTISFPDLDASEWEGAAGQRTATTAPPRAATESGPTTMARVAFREADDRPCAGTPYELRFGDQVRSGRTDGDGVIEEPVPATLESATLTLTDLDVEIALQIGKLDPIEKATGVQSRLNNLGFWCGAIDGKIGLKTKAALAAFQASRGLEPTGELDGVTRQKLGAAHEGGE